VNNKYFPLLILTLGITAGAFAFRGVDYYLAGLFTGLSFLVLDWYIQERYRLRRLKHAKALGYFESELDAVRNGALFEKSIADADLAWRRDKDRAPCACSSWARKRSQMGSEHHPWCDGTGHHKNEAHGL